ncbi:hypothetical protein T02_3477 [Trichinella nativa]|uniref:Uncharacterized protein n=1 Tax=Trichinella nativa TaxID=6335 RepID=A0A0V1LRQ7_9BILA|nr:hypothetical protein T02_3477 [Trichinella nativa]
MEMKTIKCSVGENPLESFQRPVFFHDSSELRNYAAVLVLPRCQIVAIAAFFMISPVTTKKYSKWYIDCTKAKMSNSYSSVFHDFSGVVSKVSKEDYKEVQKFSPRRCPRLCPRA